MTSKGRGPEFHLDVERQHHVHSHMGYGAKPADDDRRGLSLLRLCQHALLWSTLYVAASTAYIAITTPIDRLILALSCLLSGSCVLSILYLTAHSISACLETRPSFSGRPKLAHRVAVAALKLAIVAWLIASGSTLTMIVAKHPSCPRSPRQPLGALDIGTVCVLQRAGVGASLLCLIASVSCFALARGLPRPYRSHLFGVVAENHHHHQHHRPARPRPRPNPFRTQAPMLSELSFKCRSPSTTFTSPTTPATSTSEPGIHDEEPPTTGLGISPDPSNPSLTALILHARPSLPQILSQASTSLPPPPESPLPPLPAFAPLVTRARGARAWQTRRGSSGGRRAGGRVGAGGVRLVPPSPALAGGGGLEEVNSSVESFSSLYSRGEDGEAPWLEICAPPAAVY